MYALVFSFAVLLVGAEADSYADVGLCKDVVVDETYTYPNVSPLLYLHSITKLPGTELLDGTVITSKPYPDDEELLLTTIKTHTKDGAVTTEIHDNIIIDNGVVADVLDDENGKIKLQFFSVVIGQIPECGVLVYYRCSELGTLSQDVLQVLKKDKAPLSDACEAKVAAIMKDKGVEISPLYVLPYALKNYS